jgi:hypothetical protein
MDNHTTASVRVCLPFHLRNLAQVGPEVTVQAARPVTVKSVLDAVEARYPMLRGTIRDYDTGKRRAFLRFFACEEDFSLEPMETELPQAVAEGREPLLVVGAIAGGTERLRSGLKNFYARDRLGARMLPYERTCIQK